MKKIEQFYNESQTKAKTRYSILNAATELFTQWGMESITMVQVAKEADITIRNLYRYYPNKDLLVVDAAYYSFTVNDTVENIVIDDNWTGFDSLKYMLETLYKGLSEENDIMKFIKFIMYFDLYISKMDKECEAFKLYTTKYVSALNYKVKKLLSEVILKGLKDGTINIPIEKMEVYEEFILQSIMSVLMRVIVKEYENVAINRSLLDMQIEMVLNYVKK